MKHCMIDIETLGTTDDAVILSVGVVIFNEKEIITKGYCCLDIVSQVRSLNRVIDPTTLKWWIEQAEKMPVDGDLYLEQLVTIINEATEGCETFWERGNFDLRILQNFFASHARSVPWKFYQVRDHRTVFPKMPKTNNHNALDDAIAQVECLLASDYDLTEGVKYNA